MSTTPQALSAVRISADVNAGIRTAQAVAADVIERLAAWEAVQPQTFIQRQDAAALLEAARHVDQRVAAGEHLALAGVPFAVKDNIDVAGVPTTAACPDFAFTPQRSAGTVDRLVAAGALFVGKTNLDQFATGLVGTRSPYGAPRCVFNQDYISGGSSSGSAVAVAAAVAAFALGTDTAGSGRVPAAFNGLIGLKPTRGRWSTRGMLPACRTLDCISVFTADTGDAALVDQVLTAFDAEDEWSRPEPAATPILPAGSFRFGVPQPGQLQFFGDAESAALYQRAIERLTAAGGTAVSIDIEPLLRAARLLYTGPWVAERTAALETLLRTRPASIHPVVRGIITAGAGVTGVETFRGIYELQACAAAAARIWTQVDVLALPTAPSIYRVSELLADPIGLNSNLGFYTNFVNLLDMSAVAVPAGFRRNATGFGLTLVARAWMDRPLLDLAQRYLAAGAPFETPPVDAGKRQATVQLAVVGAHLAGMPLHWQLTSRAARLVRSTRTAPAYHLYAMADTTPPKPALVHVGDGGGGIELEIYELGLAEFGSFVAEVPAPLAIGTVTLADGSQVKGFVAEPRALAGARDITALGGWRAYITHSTGSPGGTR